MKIKSTIGKIRRRLWNKIVLRARNLRVYPYLYASYWHSLSHSSVTARKTPRCYLTAKPNPGAGIGHQMANWIAGYWWAKQFGLPFAHIPFSSPNWETFLGFGEGETPVSALQRMGYKKRRLPLFSQSNQKEINRTKEIISSYANQKVVFVCEQDQFYKDQYGVISEIQEKFYGARARQTDRLTYTDEQFNIAIHIRRGDITVGQKNQNKNLTMRWQNNAYFVNVLRNTLTHTQTHKPIAIYLFSQGKETDFNDFKQFPNLRLCLDMSVQDSFLHMIYADCLITSKSSFSYKPALLNRGIKICPKDFWHGYPETDDWILVDSDGNFEAKTKIK